MKMLKLVLLIFTMLLHSSIEVSAQPVEHIHTPQQHRHNKYAMIKNPIPMNVQSVIKGKKLYEKHCISCHGESGKGSPDLTDDLWIHGDSDGEMFYVISDGVHGTTMRGFKRGLTKDMRWHLVNYIKSLKTKNKE